MTKTTDIRKIYNAQDLIGYFAGRLGWDIDTDAFDSIEDVSYEFTAQDLGLNEEAFAKIRALRLLRPFDEKQKWAVFYIEFDGAKFEVSALRKVLSELIPRRRKSPNQPVWNMKDILFLCDWGETANRTVGLAHFEEREKSAPQIKVISCTPSSNMADPKELSTFEERLSGLAWPTNTADTKEWTKAWSKAFTLGYRENIKRSSELTVALATVAAGIRNRILETLAVESSLGHVHLLWEKFRKTLVADMSAEQFADVYAQTMVYGLFSARCMDETPEDFSVEEAIDCIPTTNPFLKNLMRASLGVRDTRNKLSFDELEIGDVVDLLLNADMTEIVKDFNRQSGGAKEDPVLYFYEGFAAEYDKAKKIKCGEFYTPLPVVNFIVRAVDDILKKDFGYEDGLATTATKKIKVTKPVYVKSRKSCVERDVEEVVPAVQILDPATGTGTFLRQTILKIHENFLEKYKGTPPDALREAWNVYVAKQLLPRLNGFELNMAPYAVAHMKLAMALKDTGYDFRGNERLRVYLTNSLEEPGSALAQPEFWEDPLAAESIAANAAKKNRGINVVIGNPPYSGESQNKGEWIMRLMEDYKKEPGGLEKLKERNPKWINDDYVKFLRFGQEYIAEHGEGILVYICPHGFIDNPTFRGMRWKLLKTYDEIYVLNLHGNANKLETCPDGSKDENVFDIMQGVSINLFVKRNGQNDASQGHKEFATVHYAEVWGLRESKYEYLSEQLCQEVDWRIVKPLIPYYLFIPQEGDTRVDYEKGCKIDELMPLNGMGITTAHDDFVVGSKRCLREKFTDFRDASSDEDLYKLFGVSRKAGWDIKSGHAAIQGNKDVSEFIRPLAYRIFDDSHIFYEDHLVWRTVRKVFRHFLDVENCGICILKICSRDDELPVFVTNKITDKTLLSSKDNANVFPLYLYTENIGKVEKKPNFDKVIFDKICSSLQASKHPNAQTSKPSPEDVFHYIYAVLHTPEYRAKYKEFLKIDFPRIPYPKDAASFRALAKIGEELVATHLLKSAAVTTGVEGSKVAEFCGEGDNEVVKPVFESGAAGVRALPCVRINGVQGFDNVPEVAWNFYIGGYQPAQKWLKDRKGRKLSSDDIVHYRQIIHALLETDRLMKELSAISGTWM